MKKIFLSIVLATLALAAPAAASTPTFVAATFIITPGALGDVDLDLTISAENAAPAKIVIYVPQGYRLDTSPTAGTTVGSIDATADLSGNPLIIPTGTIVSDNPANYTSNPQAQACAPGTHTAVWVAHVANFAIPIFVDATTGTEGTLGAYKLQVCLTAPEASNPQVRLTEAQLNFTQTVLTNPVSPNDYLWRVLVTPYVAGSSTPNLTGTYELRSDVALPAMFTLKKSAYNKKTKRATLTGKFVLLGQPTSGFPIAIFSISGQNVKIVAQAKTNKKGVYSAHVRLTKTTRFQALVPELPINCDPNVSSAAPAGCVSETVTPYFSNVLTAKPK